MKRNQLFLAVAAVLGSAALGCGDNSRQCGPGTSDIDGVCTSDGNVMCTDGTTLNPDGTGCVIDPDACQDGTVLVEGACVDPGHVDPDITELAEPNGLGLFGEVSPPEGAGTITIPAVGGSFVIKGVIAPFQDIIGGPIDPVTGLPTGDGQLDVDIDSYLIETQGPVLIDITADGLHGLAAGFVALNDGAVPELELWQRFGINVNADTSKRKLYLPSAGTYVIGVADTRSLFLTGAAAGQDDPEKPAFEYYITVTQEAVPAPTPITIVDNVGQATGDLAAGDVKFFTATMGNGINDIEFSAPAEQLVESLIVANVSGGVQTFKSLADGNTGATSAITSVLGIDSADTPLIVADHVFNYAVQAIPFEVNVTTRGAGALSTDGGAVSQPTDPVDFSTFFYDVATDGEITGMDISFNVPVVGVVADENFFIFAFFTFDPGFGFFFEETFQDYTGLLRHQKAGRYYFLTFIPSDVATPPAEITVTSTYAPVATVAVTKGTPTADQTPTPIFESNPFTYAADVNTDNWQQFNATGTGSGTITLTHLNPTEVNPNNPGFGFGRLDTIVSECGAFCDDIFPLRTTTHNPNGSQVAGRILLDDATQDYLVIANTATVAGATFSLDFQRREHTDLGTIAAAASVTRDGEVLDGTTTVQRYLVKTAAGNGLDIAVTPSATIDTRLQRLNNDETSRGGLVNGVGVSVVDQVQVIQSGEGWTAFQVTQLVPATAGTFDLAVSAIAPVTYTAAASATAFSDACAGGGSVVAMNQGDEGHSVALINAPTGFEFFGFAAPQIRVFSNGFLSVDTSLTCNPAAFNCFFANAAIPGTGNPNGLIAAYWDDVDVTAGSVCQKVNGTQLIIQWQGELFLTGDPVSFQAILDGTDNSVEFVYDVAANHVATGLSATSGIENQVGTGGNQVSFNTAIAAGTSVKLTPN